MTTVSKALLLMQCFDFALGGSSSAKRCCNVQSKLPIYDEKSKCEANGLNCKDIVGWALPLRKTSCDGKYLTCRAKSRKL